MKSDEGHANCADEPPWRQLKDIADESWFVDADIDAALERVIQRQVCLLQAHWAPCRQCGTGVGVACFLLQVLA